MQSSLLLTSPSWASTCTLESSALSISFRDEGWLWNAQVRIPGREWTPTVLPTWAVLQPATSSCCHPDCRRPAPLPGVGFLRSPLPPLLQGPPRHRHPCLLLRCLRILGVGPGEDRDANGAWKLLGSGREPGGGSAAGAAGVALQKGRRMGRSWGADRRGRRGLKGRRAQVGLPWSLAISDEPTFYSSSLPCSAPSGAPDPSTVSAERRLGGCGRLGCWEKGSAGPEEVSRVRAGPRPLVSPYSLFRRCGNAGWR